MDRLKPGLDLATKLEEGRGWVAAEIKEDAFSPLSLVLESGYKLNQSWALYGDAWAQPGIGTYGADIGARFRDNFDIYAGGWVKTDGTYSASAGAKWTF